MGAETLQDMNQALANTWRDIGNNECTIDNIKKNIEALKEIASEYTIKIQTAQSLQQQAVESVPVEAPKSV